MLNSLHLLSHNEVNNITFISNIIKSWLSLIRFINLSKVSLTLGIESEANELRGL